MRFGKRQMTVPRVYSKTLPFDDCPRVMGWLNLAEGEGYTVTKPVGTCNQYRFQLIASSPLTLVVSYNSVSYYLQPDKDFLYDQETVPWWLHWFEDKDDHPVSGVFHDSGLVDKGLFMATTSAGPYEFMLIPRDIMDLLFRQMVQLEPPKVSPMKARCLYWGVRLGTWWAHR